MNQINPKKLLKSKWTAINPVNKEKHFIVSKVTFDQDLITACHLEAVMTKRVLTIDWKELKDDERWIHGWK